MKLDIIFKAKLQLIPQGSIAKNANNKMIGAYWSWLFFEIEYRK